jgi:2-succinyl-5-enolpyruvyl-6-hydroxy-3-cyclohexene-1-carboxylate synthase
MLGNSMPIRLFDNYLFSTNADTIVTNRGASGIDGLVATTAGYAEGSANPMTLVIGDLSLLHDLNSLALLKQLTTPLKIIVLNNDGGGIFDRLPSAELHDVHEKYFTTPHGLKFKNAAAMFELNYASVDNNSKLEEVYSEAAKDSNNWLIELKIDRHVSFAHQQSVLQKLIEQFKNDQ